ncbi:hypothetical protein F2S72_09250 [Pseudomonas syringae pv. actinidiae]|nr:hypothetical protein [Pseudomonas syringae pv. actinidiae]
MTDAYVFEVHPASDVLEVNGKKAVVPTYLFDKDSLQFSRNPEPNRTLPTCGRHKKDGVIACVAILRKDQFLLTAVPGDCYVEKSF